MRPALGGIASHTAVKSAGSYQKSDKKVNSLSVLEAAFAGRVEEPDEMSAAHVRDLVNAVIAVLVRAEETYRIKPAMSLAVR